MRRFGDLMASVGDLVELPGEVDWYRVRDIDPSGLAELESETGDWLLCDASQLRRIGERWSA